MGKTYTKKIEARESRLAKLPTSERLRQSAIIKKKEGRVLDSAEKHALMMTTEYGEALKLWEVLRTLDEQGQLGLSEAQEKRAKKRERLAKKPKIGNKKTGSIVTKFGDSDNEDSSESDADDETQEPTTSKKNPNGLRGAERFAHKYPTIDRLFEIIEPKFDNFVRTPRISRVIQSMIKYGSAAHLEKLTTLLSKDFATYACDSFGHYVVIALFKHAPHALFRKLLAVLINDCATLCKHAVGLRVIHTAYTSKLCTAGDKNLMLLGVFKDGVAVMKNWKGYPDIEAILAQEKDQQKRLVAYLYSLVDKLVCQKDAYTFPFVQRLTLIFMRFGNKDDVMDMCDSLRPHLQNLVSSGKDGALLASLTFSLLEPKMRKEPLRLFSQAFLENATGKFSAPVMARLFDIVYDAQLLSKFVVEPLLANLPAIIDSPYGYLILIHILTPSLAQKDRLWTPSWNEYNLYSRENKKWNTHTWLDNDFNEETVEICPKPAEQTHIAILRPIIEALVQIGESFEESKVQPYRFGLVAREAVNLAQHDASYKAVFAGLDLSTLKTRSVLDKRDRDAEDEEEREVTVAAPAKKQGRSEKKTTEKNLSSSPSSSTPKRKTGPAASGKSPANASLDLFSPIAPGSKAPPTTPNTARKAPPQDADRPAEKSARRGPADDEEDMMSAKKIKKNKVGSEKKLAPSAVAARKEKIVEGKKKSKK